MQFTAAETSFTLMSLNCCNVEKQHVKFLGFFAVSSKLLALITCIEKNFRLGVPESFN